MKFTHVLLFYVNIVISIPALSNTYFVSNNGSNLNKGSILRPYKTIEFAINSSSNYDSIFIRKGEYFESIILNSKKNIYISSYNNEDVKISPFLLKSIQNWEKHTEKIYKTKIDETVFQLFLNEKPIMQASHPNMKEELFNNQNAADVIVSYNKTINFPGISQFGSLTSGYFLSLCSDNIVSIGGNIINSSEDQISITDSAFYWKTDFENSYLGKGKGYLVGNIAFLDSPNEWYSDGEYLFVYPSNKNELEKIYIRNNLYVFQIFNSEYINISDVKIVGGSIIVQESSNCTLTNLTIKYPVPFHKPWSGFERYSPYWNGKEELTVGPSLWTGKGVEIGGEKNKLINCYIAHSWGDGATIYGIGNTVENCIIEDCDWIANDCAVLNISGSNHIVSNNTLKNSARSILLTRKLYNSKIYKNDISFGGLRCTDLGLIYNYDTDGKNTEIANNFIHDSQSKNNGVGIYLDENNKNHSLHHNIITNCSVGINLNKPCKKTSVYNNTLYKNEFSMGAWGSGKLDTVYTFNNITDTDKKLSWNYDAFYGTKMDSNYVYFENNIFIDPENHNFNLKKYSYPIDNGITNEYTLPFKGKAPDLGAIESDSELIEYGASIIIENEQHYPPKAPLKLKIITNTPTTTFLTWTYPFNYIDSFFLERKISGDTFKIIAKLPALTLNYNDSNQPPGEYRYRVKAVNKYGISDPSNSVEIFNPKYENSLFLDAENNDRNNGTNKSGDVIINNDNNDWICYKQVDYGNQNFDACIVNMAVPCEQAWEEIQLRIDRPMGRMIGNLTTTSTGGWDKFEQRTFPIEKISGKRDTYIKFKGNQGLGTIDWFNLYNSQGNIKKQYPTDPICPQQRNTSRLIPITIYPNPSSEELAVAIENLETSDINIKFASTEGILLLDKTETKQQPGTQEYYLHNHINIPSLTKGFYHLQITITGKRITQTKNYKFIKN